MAQRACAGSRTKGAAKREMEGRARWRAQDIVEMDEAVRRPTRGRYQAGTCNVSSRSINRPYSLAAQIRAVKSHSISTRTEKRDQSHFHNPSEQAIKMLDITNSLRNIIAFFEACQLTPPS
jgi:hypothetical protein